MAVIHRSPPVSALVRLLAALALLAALVPAVDTRLAPTALAASFVVNQAADPGDGTCDGTCTLRDAILNANTVAGHDTITFSPAVTTAIVLGSALPTIAQALTIDGSGQAITVDGASLYRPFQATAPLTLTALTIQRGKAPNGGFGGGGAYFASTGTVWGVSFISNTATGEGGGGAYFASTAILSDAVFISNTVTNGSGGGAYVGGTAAVTGAVFMTNTTNFNGGGLFVLASATISGATFISNTTSADGGGVYVFGAAAVTGSTFIRNQALVSFNASGGGASFSSAASLVNSTFMSNTAFFHGGGVKFWQAAAVSDSTFTGNTAGSGGGVYLAEGGGVTNTAFVSNTALADGGGLYLDAFTSLSGPGGGDIAPISGSTFTGNTAAGAGGGAYLGGRSDISGSAFRGNRATTVGGGIIGVDGNFYVITGTTFVTNTAGSGGGASLGSATVVSSTFISNTATGLGLGLGGGGGGAQFTLDAWITASSFLHNLALGHSGRGGGAYFHGAAVMTGTTFMSNTAANGNGGGLYGGVITATNTTVTGNQAMCEDEQLARPGSASGPPADCGDGGGAYAATHSALLKWFGGEFEGNVAERDGGGMYLNGLSFVEFDVVIIQDNTAGEEGGGAYLDNVLAADWGRIEFSDNEAGEDGGGVFLNESQLEIANAIFFGNTVANPNGAADISMSFHDASLDAKHVTFVPRFIGFQLAVSVGTDLPDEHGQQDTVATLVNTLFHGYDIGVQGQAPTSTATMTGVLWSNITTPWQFGNFSLNLEYTGPAEFVDEGAGDLHLTALSHAIDRGVQTNVLADFDGAPRPQGLAPDLGAYEHTALNFAKIYLPSVLRGP